MDIFSRTFGVPMRLVFHDSAGRIWLYSLRAVIVGRSSLVAMCDALRVNVFLSLIIQAVWRHTALHAAF